MEGRVMGGLMAALERCARAECGGRYLVQRGDCERVCHLCSRPHPDDVAFQRTVALAADTVRLHNGKSGAPFHLVGRRRQSA